MYYNEIFNLLALRLKEINEPNLALKKKSGMTSLATAASPLVMDRRNYRRGLFLN